MAHEIETMAYAGETPWHGLGARVDGDIGVDEMLVKAGLDWKVEKRALFTFDDNGQKSRVNGRYALVRSSDNRVLTLTGPAWKPLQNSEVLGFFRDYADAGGCKLETAGSLRGGKFIWGLAKINHSFEASPGDVVNGYLLFMSPHQVGSAITISTTTIRVVCMNTMRMALEDSATSTHHRQNHLKEFDRDSAAMAVEAAHEQLYRAGQEARALVNVRMSTFDTVRLLSSHFQENLSRRSGKDMVDPANWNKHLAGVMASVNSAPGAQPGTAWGVLNGVTHWIDHEAGRVSDTRILRAWLGDYAKVKLQVNQDLLQLAA